MTVIHSQKGFTLIELMIAIAIAAILLAIAAPSFRSTIERSNVDSLVDSFTGSVITARTEAASRGLDVRVCASEACDANNWQNGWFIVDANNLVLTSYENKSGYAVSVKTKDDVVPTAITFNAQGYNKDQVRYTFAACGPNNDIIRGATVEFSGRAYRTDSDQKVHKAQFDDGNGNAEGEKDLGCD